MTWIHNPCANSICLPEPVAASLADSSWGTSPCAPLKSSPTASRCLSPGNVMASCPHSPSGMTCVPLTDTPGADTSMSSVAGSPAKTLATPANDKAFLGHAQVCGQSMPASLGRYDPATSSLRTSQRLLFEDSTASLRTLPRRGWMRGGVVWGLTMSVRPTGENAYGYWPTPKAQELHGEKYTLEMSFAHWRERRQVCLSQVVSDQRMWPTPAATSAEGKGDLIQAIRGNANRHYNLWATPHAHNAHGAPGKACQERGGHQSDLVAQVGGTLNPTWVAWLMGWPLGWTSLAPLGMDKYHAWQQRHGTCLEGHNP